MEVDCFDGTADFALWLRRMHAVLVQQKVARILGGEKKQAETITADHKADMMDNTEKAGMMDTTFRSLILHLSDKVLREIASEKTAVGIWAKLESVYMSKPP